MDRFRPWDTPAVAAPPGEIFGEPFFPCGHPNFRIREGSPDWNLDNWMGEPHLHPYAPTAAESRFEEWISVIYGPDGKLPEGVSRSYHELNALAPRFSGFLRMMLERQALSILLQVDRSWYDATMAYTWEHAEIGSVLGQIGTVSLPAVRFT